MPGTPIGLSLIFEVAFNLKNLTSKGPRNDLFQKTVPGRVRVKFAQNEGHEKATEKPRKNHEKATQADEGHEKATKKPRKSYEKVTSKNLTSNEKSSDFS